MSQLFLLSILLCLIAGAAIDTSNICLVRGSELLVRGKPAMALGILLVTACASIVFWLNTTFQTHHRAPAWAYPTLFTVTGGVLFGLGASLNGTCAVGTIKHLARGEIGRLSPIFGAAVVFWWFPHPAPAARQAAVIHGTTSFLLVVLAVTVLLMIAARRHLAGARFGSFVALGLSAAIVTDWQGSWTWTSLAEEMSIRRSVQVETLACLTAVLLGAGFAAWLTGRFRLLWPSPMMALRGIVGGGLMAAGASLIPGANDALSVFGVPSGSPQAIVGYLAMTAAMLMIAKVRFFAAEQRVGAAA